MLGNIAFFNELQSIGISLKPSQLMSGYTRRTNNGFEVFFKKIDDNELNLDLLHELGHIATANEKQLNSSECFGFENRFSFNSAQTIIETEAKALAAQYHLYNHCSVKRISFYDFWDLERETLCDVIYSNLDVGTLDRKSRLQFKRDLPVNLLSNAYNLSKTMNFNSVMNNIRKNMFFIQKMAIYE